VTVARLLPLPLCPPGRHMPCVAHAGRGAVVVEKNTQERAAEPARADMTNPRMSKEATTSTAQQQLMSKKSLHPVVVFVGSAGRVSRQKGNITCVGHHQQTTSKELQNAVRDVDQIPRSINARSISFRHTHVSLALSIHHWFVHSLALPV
jgi:hypothetical protein